MGLAGQILNRSGTSWHRSLCPSYLLPPLSSCLPHGYGDPEDGQDFLRMAEPGFLKTSLHGLPPNVFPEGLSYFRLECP